MNINKTLLNNKKNSLKTLEVSTLIKNITLDGLKLQAEKVTTTFEVLKTNNPSKILSKNLIDEKIEFLIFPLTEVTIEDLYTYRKKGISSFVLKINDTLYYTKIPKEMNFISSDILGEHKCAIVKHECNRLSPASDEEGGCEKVRNFSKYIERYPWIKKGYETFNTRHDSFAVIECLHYQECPPRKHRSHADIIASKIRLAQYFWEDVETLEDIRKKREKKKNIKKY